MQNTDDDESELSCHPRNTDLNCRWNLKNDQSEQLIPDPGTSILRVDIDSLGQYMAVVNSKVSIYIL